MTSQHAALYRAVCDHPDEDTPRLMFADLLEEDGEPDRAAFIRTQVELARAPEYDPLWAKCRQFHPDAARGWMMAHILPPLPRGFGWHRHRFRRGFPWLATGTAEALIERGPDLFAAAPVQALDIGDRRNLYTLGGLADCPHLARLRRLEFSLTRFDPDDLTPLGHSPHAANLTELAFEDHAITPEGLQALAASPLFPRLTALELAHNIIPPALLVDGLGAARHGNLRRLALRFCSIPTPDAAHLFALPVLHGLEELDLGDNPNLGPDGAKALAESGVVRGLAVLKLAKTLPGVPGVRALTETSALAGVRWLDLSANRLGPTAVGLLAGSRHARGLRVLDLSDNPDLGDRGAEALAGSRHLAGLIELVLRDCGIGDAGATALAESPYLDGLLRLDLRSSSKRPLGADARRRLEERFGPCVSWQ